MAREIIDANRYLTPGHRSGNSRPVGGTKDLRGPPGLQE